jgi:hypothetical protein
MGISYAITRIVASGLSFIARSAAKKEKRLCGRSGPGKVVSPRSLRFLRLLHYCRLSHARASGAQRRYTSSVSRNGQKAAMQEDDLFAAPRQTMGSGSDGEGSRLAL